MNAESVTLRQFVCPHDNTILEPSIHKNCDGRYECPTCRKRYDPHEVLP